MKVTVTWPSEKNLENQVFREHGVRHPSLKHSHSCCCVQSPEESWELVGKAEAASACWSPRKAGCSDWWGNSRQPAAAGPKGRRCGHHEGLDCPDGLDSVKVWKTTELSLFFSFSMFMCGGGGACVSVHMFLHVWRHMYVDTHVCKGPMSMSEIILDHSSTLFFKAGPLNQSQSSRM